MSDTTNDVKTERDTDRRILRICRRVAKQPETVRDTCDRILTVTSLSIMMPRSRTADDGVT